MDDKQNTARFYTGTYEQYLATQEVYGHHPLTRDEFDIWQSLDRERFGLQKTAEASKQDAVE
jgi:hypothetical protein